MQRATQKSSLSLSRITTYLLSVFLGLTLWTSSTHAEAQQVMLTHITPAVLGTEIVYPSGTIVIPQDPLHTIDWVSITLPSELVKPSTRIQLWDQDNHVIHVFGSKQLNSPVVDISMIDATLYPSIRIVLFDTEHTFTLSSLYPATFTYRDTFNTRLVLFIGFFALLLCALAINLIRSHVSLLDILKNILRLPDNAPFSYSVFGSLCALTLFACALGSYTSATHTIYLIIKLPVLFFGALTLSTLSVYILLMLLSVQYTLHTLLSVFGRALLFVSLILASFSPLVVFYVFYPFSHDTLLTMMMLLFGIAALGGVVSLGQYFWGHTRSPVTTAIIVIVWLIIYGSVLMQLGWMLRPWVGVQDPVFHTVPFARPYSGNVFTEIIHTLKRL